MHGQIHSSDTTSPGGTGPPGLRPPSHDCGRDHLNVGSNRTACTDPLKRSLLKNSKQFGLQYKSSSPISSSNRVPPSASSNAQGGVPLLREGPFPWPKSSLSSKGPGKVAQLTAKKPSFRGECSWIHLVATSLPTPDSPVRRHPHWLRQ